MTLRGAEITERALGCVLPVLPLHRGSKWGSAYLTRAFFSLLGERLGDRVVLMVAEHDGTPVAGALNLMGEEALYGRNWGCRGDWPFLHFELCYYRAIDFAIEHGLQRVEAGAQGEHKIQRGYLPADLFGALDRASRPARGGRRLPRRSGAAMLREMAALAEYLAVQAGGRVNVRVARPIRRAGRPFGQPGRGPRGTAPGRPACRRAQCRVGPHHLREQYRHEGLRARPRTSWHGRGTTGRRAGTA